MTRAKVRIDGQQRREALLDAAMRCFERRGVLGTGIEDIRREAKASPSSVYHQFEDVNAIMLALLVRVFEGLFSHLAIRVRRTHTAEGAVRALVDGHLEWIAKHRAEGRFMYQAMTLEAGGLTAAGRAQLVKQKERLLLPVVEHLAPFIARKELPNWPPIMFDVVLLGASHEALRRWLGGAKELAPAGLRRVLPKLAWASLGHSDSDRSTNRSPRAKSRGHFTGGPSLDSARDER